MESENIFIILPENAEQTNAHKAFVSKIKKSREEFNEGNFIPVEKDNLQKFLGLQ